MSKANKSLIVLFLSILIVSFVTLPIIGYFSEKREILAHTNTRLETLEANEIRLQEIEKEISKKQDLFTKLGSAIPSEPMIPSSIRFLQRLAAENGLSLTSIGNFSTISSSLKSHINETQISFSMRGGYNNLKSFLRALENSAKIFEIENISIDSSFTSDIESVEETGSSLFNFEIMLKTFSY